MTMKQLQYVFIGAGNMGAALINGILSKGIAAADTITAVDTDTAKLDRLKVRGVYTTTDIAAAIKNAGIIILCVKPQSIDSVAAAVAQGNKNNTPIISIAAGITIARLQKHFSSEIEIIRVMPNTPALIGYGMSGLAFAAHVSEKTRTVALSIFNAIGETVVVDEPQLDAITGLSGSGPAYIFQVIQALAAGGIDQGLPEETAVRCAVQTVRGAAELIKQTGESPDTLTDKVSSPGGTTVAGLAAIRKQHGFEALREGVAAATQRSRELGGGK